ncbi:MAG: 2Fe-2S iron-sulfur cluster-binding protein [Acidimicrobiales bacterium]
MSGSELTADARRAPRDLGYHSLRVLRVVRETEEARSFVLDVPPELRQAYAYRAGQFVNVRAAVDGTEHVRCYSMSSSPGVDPELQVTVKRVPDGIVSNFLCDCVTAGDLLEVGLPTGFFQLTEEDEDVVAFAAGSGITPVFSLLKAALAGTDRRVHLLYANRDRPAVIFAEELDHLARTHADRLRVVHHLDDEQGFVDDEAVVALADGTGSGPCYLCGPEPFMDTVERALLGAGVTPGRLHVERFSPTPPPLPPPPADGTTDVLVTIELDGRTESTPHRPGATILQTARQAGLAPPFSCESGNCATCMAHLAEGSCSMLANNALTDDEVADGWVLTCQAVPTSGPVRVVYGF